MAIPAPVKEHGFAIGGATLACGYLAFAGIGRCFGRHFKLVEGGSILGAAAAIALVGEGAQWLMSKSRAPKTELDHKLVELRGLTVPSQYKALLENESDPETLKAYGREAPNLGWLLKYATGPQLAWILEGCLEKDTDRLEAAAEYLRVSKPTHFSIAARFCAQPNHLPLIGPNLKRNYTLYLAMEEALETDETKKELEDFKAFFATEV